MRGKFITLEGVDGAGKSSHVESIAALLRARGRRVLVTREPGGTPLAEKLRALVLTESMDPLSETLLMFSARSDHLRRVLAPALAEGTWVVCDRFTDATVAYQGGGKGVSLELIECLRGAVHPDLEPDLTLIFDCPFEVARERMGRTGKALDRFEREGREFFERVRGTYLRTAAAQPERIRVIDASGELFNIKKSVEQYVVSV
ncbi:MAG: dTMP kinase [Betaproteobacteria bacterium]|nr:dTMP kinase [Betaproteobacteria bacterium]